MRREEVEDWGGGVWMSSSAAFSCELCANSSSSDGAPELAEGSERRHRQPRDQLRTQSCGSHLSRLSKLGSTRRA